LIQLHAPESLATEVLKNEVEIRITGELSQMILGSRGGRPEVPLVRHSMTSRGGDI
jgi:hypothetical protein